MFRNRFGRQKLFWTETCVTPSPLLIHKFLRYRKFSETQKVSPTKFFGTVRQQSFDRKLWYPPLFLIPKVFRYQKFPESQKGSSTKFFGTFRQVFDRKLWYSFPPPLIHKILRYLNFSETQKVFLTKFLCTEKQKSFNGNPDTLLHKVQKSVVELMFVKKFES